MAEYYVGLRQAHIGFAMLSIALFTVRGGIMLAESRLLQARPLQILPHVSDTMRMTTALMLTTVINQNPF